MTNQRKVNDLPLKSIFLMKTQNKKTQPIKEEQGSRQGQKAASLHFKTFFRKLIRMVNGSGLGIRISNEHTVSVMVCADDTFLCADTKERLAQIIKLAEKFSVQFRLNFWNGPIFHNFRKKAILL